MKQNDSRINAYKKVAGFKAQQISADEVEQNNAAIEALLAKEKKAAIDEIATRPEILKKLGVSVSQDKKSPAGTANAAQPAASSPEKEKPTFQPLNWAGSLPSFESKPTAKPVSTGTINSASLTGTKASTVKASTVSPSQNSRGNNTQFDVEALEQRKQGFVPGFAKVTQVSQSSADSSIQDAMNRHGMLKIPEPDAASISSAQKTGLQKTDLQKGESAYRRVAKFLLLIGIDEAARVISHLSQEQVDKIVPEIASIRSVSPDEATVIMTEFDTLLRRAKEGGGVETARNILERAFGEERAEQLMQKAVPYPEGKPFEYLKEMDAQRLLILLKDESAPVRALVLSRMKPAVAAQVIQQLAPADQKETVQRLAKLTTPAPDIMRRIDQAMQEKCKLVQTSDADSVDGRSALVDILRRMDSSAEKDILSTLSAVDPDLEKELRERLFTLDDVVFAEDKFIQERLRIMQDGDIAILIAGKAEAFRQKIFANISKGRGATVLEEESLRKPIPKKESDRVTNDFFAIVRRAWENGELHVQNHDQDQWVM